MTKKDAILRELRNAQSALANVHKLEYPFLIYMQLQFIIAIFISQVRLINGELDFNFFAKMAKRKRLECILNAKKRRRPKKEILNKSEGARL
jgi:hypothetical protein